MPYNVLLLPLIGGYVFITYWNPTRFNAKRYSGERLLIHAALAGLLFLAISYVFMQSVAAWRPDVYAWWHARVPFPHTGTSLLALLMAAFLWWPLNLSFCRRPKYVRRAIEEWNDYLEILLRDVAEDTTQFAVTLRNGKVYIGFALRPFDPAYERRYIVILPTISGYRHTETHVLTFTTDYTAVYQQLIADNAKHAVDGFGDFEIIIPVAEIVSASRFDWDAYRKFVPDYHGPWPGEQ